MYQVIEQTDEEKKAMYMELPKEKLVEMLVQCNKIIGARNKLVVPSHPDTHTHYFIQYDDHWRKCAHCGVLEPIYSPYRPPYNITI
jgi:hypothetical protein